MKQYPTQAELKALFVYKDGQLLRNGKAIGCLNNGYIRANINYKKYNAHRLIYIYHHGEADINLEIDHLNRNRNDNRIENLRLVTKGVNNENTGKKYSWSKYNKRFIVQFRNKHIGCYVTECAARINAAMVRLNHGC